MTGNSDGAPYSGSGTTPPSDSTSTPPPVQEPDKLHEDWEYMKKVGAGLVDAGLEVVKEVYEATSPVILAPIKELKKEAGIEESDDA
jgi:hypothetical protein